MTTTKLFILVQFIDRSLPSAQSALGCPRSQIQEFRLPGTYANAQIELPVYRLQSIHFSLKLSLLSAPQLPERLHLLDPRIHPRVMTEPAKNLPKPIGNHQPTVSGLILAHQKYWNELENPRRWPAINHRLRLIRYPAKVICSRQETLQIACSYDYRTAHQVVFPPWTLSHVAELAQMGRKVARGRRVVEHANASSISSSALPLQIGDVLLTQNPATVLPLAHGNQRVKRPGNGSRFRPQFQFPSAAHRKKLYLLN